MLVHHSLLWFTGSTDSCCDVGLFGVVALDLALQRFWDSASELSFLAKFLMTEAVHLSTWMKIGNMGDDPGYGIGKTRKAESSQSNAELSGQDDGCRLFLGLGPTPTSYCAGHTAEIGKPKRPASLFSQMPLCGADHGILQLGLAGGYTEPVLPTKMQLESKRKSFSLIIDNEGSTSARKSGAYLPSLLFAPVSESPSCSKGIQESQFEHSPEPSGMSDCSLSTNSNLLPSSHRHPPKKCKFNGCSKGARGASGLCIAHGGGQRCQKPGCNKGAECRTAYCKAHGGGRRCHFLGCTKSAEGKTDYCIAHGGGRRCGHPGCSKASRGKSGLCIRHGGGKRCTVVGCTRSAEGQAGLCISHGGGRRCQFSEGCSKGAQGSTMYCKAHGGGRRCVFEGCNKGAEGSTPLCKGHGGGRRCLYEGGGVCPKSVHGGTNFCVAHGGGKRCVVFGCTRSARGRTDRCVRHGGGKRCHYEGCGKSAQGSTNYCKAHGGGKRCCWNGGCEKFARGRSGLCAAHGNAATAAAAAVGGGLIGHGLFEGLVSATTAATAADLSSELVSATTMDSSSGASVLSDCCTTDSSENSGKANESLENMGKRQPLIPTQVLFPPEVKLSRAMPSRMATVTSEGKSGFVIPEGRVHGGGLLTLLGGSIRNPGFSGRV
ncbi:hypothetical protein IEQ34_019447 [Dendrobium chrysotoxum]|uniref:WRKY19-like zinc finger domain-containing protein n=1 Tax=Dendrobium chrysotoxum TaxID=161865 RepID=A0AAV7G9Z5_DENCH|nr:hypothetical protein IEQ34_019447 [Dendrobium chrysotoxum]